MSNSKSESITRFYLYLQTEVGKNKYTRKSMANAVRSILNNRFKRQPAVEKILTGLQETDQGQNFFILVLLGRRTSINFENLANAFGKLGRNVEIKKTDQGKLISVAKLVTEEDPDAEWTFQMDGQISPLKACFKRASNIAKRSEPRTEMQSSDKLRQRNNELEGLFREICNSFLKWVHCTVEPLQEEEEPKSLTKHSQNSTTEEDQIVE